MTKFKILKWALLIFIIAYFAAIVFNIKLIYDLKYDIGTPPAPQGVIFKISCNSILGLLFTFGLYYVYKSCTTFISRGYFNGKSALYLKRGGYILTINALIRFIIIALTVDDSTFNANPELKDFLSGMSSNITVLIIAFSLIAVSDIIKKGNKIKEENDLTI
ncbi:MAG: hypothetical protein DI539_19320 [Flavobacterium psychrophilum]|nr:MAG: hypothetical protein DI539_19320 [Flavobacterium psychrophilum]